MPAIVCRKQDGNHSLRYKKLQVLSVGAEGSDAVFSDIDLILESHFQIDGLARLQGRGTIQGLVDLSIKAVLDLGDFTGKGFSGLRSSVAVNRLEFHVFSQELQFVIGCVAGHFPDHSF